jgi:MoaA/NifB/PqqE/SkfB family radical SAM enzyme
MEPVGQCNLRCEMCPVVFRQDGPDDGRPAFLSYESFCRTIDEFQDLQDLHLQGLGEPLMHPRFFDMVEYAAGRGIKVSTNTNLSVLSPQRAERCVTSGLDCMHISIDAASPALYAKIRRGSRLDRILRNLGFLQEAKRRLRSVLPRQRLVMVLMRQNVHEIASLVHLASEWGFESVFVQHLCHDFQEASLPESYRSMRDFVDDQTLFHYHAEGVEAHFAAARRAAEETGVELRLPRPQQGGYAEGTPGRDRCGWPWTGMYLSYQGLAMPCCMIATPDRANFGNVGEAGAAAIWNGRSYETFREELESESPPDICRSCSVYRGIF